jgi:hypothetical protein
MTGREPAENDLPIGRPEHRYADQFTNEWAWRFEDAFRGLAWASADPADFAQRVALMWVALAEHKQEMADAWMAFFVRTFGELTAEMPIERVLTDRGPVELEAEQEPRPALDDSVVSEREQSVADDEPRGPASGTHLDQGRQDVSAAIRRTLARIEQQAGRGHEPPALGAS